MKRPNVIYAAQTYNGKAVDKQIENATKYIRTYMGDVDGVAIEKESETEKPIADRIVFRDIGSQFFLNNRVNVIIDISLLQDITAEAIERLIDYSDKYEIILLSEGKYVSHLGLTKPFSVKIYSDNENTVCNELSDYGKSYSNAAVYVCGGTGEKLSENSISQICVSELYATKVLGVDKLSVFVEDRDLIFGSLKNRVQYNAMLSKIKKGKFDLVVLTKETILETELNSAIAELREYAGVVVVDEGEGYMYLEKAEAEQAALR